LGLLETSFVGYLRKSILRWGGFPGMAKWPKTPDDDLRYLTQDLQPF